MSKKKYSNEEKKVLDSVKELQFNAIDRLTNRILTLTNGAFSKQFKKAARDEKQLIISQVDNASKVLLEQRENDIFESNWKALTGENFTIKQARKVLLDTADKAIKYLHAEDNRAQKFKAKFHNILDALPFEELPRIAELIKSEVMAHLELNHGDIIIVWLEDADN